MTDKQDLPPLPDPKFIFHSADDSSEEALFEFSVNGAVDEGCDRCERLYSADQVREAQLEAIRSHEAERGAQEHAVAAFDVAVSEELPLVSHVHYDSHEICKHFAGEVRKRLLAAEASSPVQAEAPSREWLASRLAIADDSNISAGRPCDGPPGCNSHNCLGCDDFATPPTASPVGTDLSDEKMDSVVTAIAKLNTGDMGFNEFVDFCAALAAKPASPVGERGLPFAVFDEFGQGCEDRVADHYRAALATQPQEVQKPVGWLHDRVGSSFNPHFKLDGKEADELRNGLPPLLTKDSNSVNWRPVYLGPQPEQVVQDSARLDWLMWHADPAEIGISIPDYQDKADYLRKYRAAIDARTRGEGA